MDQESKIWYILIDNKKQGPFTIDEVVSKEPITREKYTKGPLVWKEGMFSWLRAADVPEFNFRYNPFLNESAAAAESEPPQEPVLSKNDENAANKSGENTKKSGDNTESSWQQTAKRYVHSIIEKLKNNVIKELKNKVQNFKKDNPLLTVGIAAAIAVIFICFITISIYSPIVNKRGEKRLAAEIERRESAFKEVLEQREQALRDSFHIVEQERLKEIEQELLRKAKQDSIAKAQVRRKQTVSPPIVPSSFTDQSNGNTYRIRKFGDNFWFLEDLDKGRRFTWRQAAEACPSGWRLPSDREWRSLASALKGGAGTYFGSNYYWWSDAEGTDSWYISGGNLVCYSGNDNRDAVYRVRCVKD